MLKKPASFVPCLRRSGFAQAGQLIEILNGDPAASPTRRRAQTWCSLFVAPCAPEGTPPVSTRLRPRWTAFLSILKLFSPQYHTEDSDKMVAA